MKVPVFLLLVMCHQVHCQYVGNGSFEDFSDCPTTDGQITLATGWTACPSGAVADYFNVCGAETVSVPNNFAGSQMAFVGEGYAGLVVSSPVSGYREYIQTEINPKLSAGMQYLVSFRASAAGVCFSDNIGVALTSEPILGGVCIPAGIVPQINAGEIVTNTIGWTEISGTHVASGNELYLTIGNFYTDEATHTSGFGAAYYYIDDVSITPLLMAIDETDRGLAVQPNPFSSEVQIDFPGEIKQIAVYSPYRNVYTGNTSGTLHLGHLPAGLYNVVLTTKSGETVSKKLIKL